MSCEANEAEIQAAIKQLKNGKAPGVDIITAELLKLGEKTVVQWFPKLAASMYGSKAGLEDWVKQPTIPLHKKGAHNHCDNFRGIAFAKCPGQSLLQCDPEEVCRKSLPAFEGESV